MKLKFKKNFGGRENYFPCKLKKDRTTDCVVRAICNATQKDYMDVMRDLFAKGLEIGQMPNNKKCYELVLKDYGWVKKSPMYKSREKRTKYKLGNLPVAMFGRYIVKTSCHLTAIVNESVYDSWDCREWCANSYYVPSLPPLTLKK